MRLFVIGAMLFSVSFGCSPSAPYAIPEASETSEISETSETTLPKPTPSVFHYPRSGSETDCDLKIGEVFPAIEAVDFDSAPRALDQSMLGEKYTLVVFWSTWCGFCMKELPHEIELYEKYKEHGLSVVGINADRTIEIGQTAANENAIPWVNLYEGKDKRISKMLGIASWPALFILDADGKIIATKKFLRVSAVRTYPNGEIKVVDMLDWTLEELFASD